MRVKSVVSVLAMTAAMIAAPAFAQEAASPTMMGGVEVSEADRAAVQARCDVLVADDDSTVSDVNTSSSVTTDTETGSDDEDSLAADTSSNDSPPAEGLETSTTFDLEGITIDECIEGGWTPPGSLQ